MDKQTFRGLLKRIDDKTVLWLYWAGSLSGELNGLLYKEAIRRKLIDKANPMTVGSD